MFLSSQREFAGDPVVRTPRFHFRGHGFNPWLGKSNPTSFARRKSLQKCVQCYNQPVGQLTLKKGREGERKKGRKEGRKREKEKGKRNLPP